MKILTAAVLSLAFTGAPGAVVVYAQTAPKPAAPAPAKPAAAAPAKPAAKPAANPAARSTTPRVAPEVVEAEAVQALRTMSAFLTTQQALGLTSNASLDIVTNQGQSIQMDGVVRYKIRKPDAFVIDLDTAGKKRRYYYNGKTFTVQAPAMGFYATADAPPTIREALAVLNDRFGIQLPLEDLFRWNDAEDPARNLTSGFKVGDAVVDGAAADHYAFRQPRVDWQIWIKKGDQPLPLKIVITDQTDPAKPAYTARLSWTLNPTFAAADFTYTPSSDAMLIRMAEFGN